MCSMGKFRRGPSRSSLDGRTKMNDRFTVSWKAPSLGYLDDLAASAPRIDSGSYDKAGVDQVQDWLRGTARRALGIRG